MYVAHDAADSDSARTHGFKTPLADAANAPSTSANNNSTPLEAGRHEDPAHDAGSTSLKSLPWSLKDGRPEEEVYEEALHDLSVMEQTVWEQQKRIEDLKEAHRTQLELIQIVVSIFFSFR